MATSDPDVLIIGAGICGLTTAICLAEAGLRIDVRAELPPDRSTSAVAGAIWGPYLVGMDDRVARWLDDGLAVLRAAASDPATGVRLVSGRQLTAAPGQARPAGLGALGGVRPCQAGELPAGFASGWAYTAPVVSMGTYLGHLLGRLDALGVRPLFGARFGSLAEAMAGTAAPVVVNCSGIGARDLVPDPAVVPARGQVVVVANPGISEFYIGVGRDPADLTYLIPHAGIVVLGGTEQPGDWNLEPDQATAREILQRCAGVQPLIRGAAIVAHRVGLRPTRPQVALAETSWPGGRRVLHNYGHGGAGVTLAWGCAQEIARGIQRAR